ncbi:MAG: nucleotidyltransferase domain-containing protein [Desulfatirhabdiaceae bacterium]|nr:nucleotidyltransferase domain-containing protein [Desulfatirhabdiaceae bacterium]
MRLKPKEISVITSAVHEHDPQASIYLFGSRTDDSARGGDIDILVLSARLTFKDKLKIKARIFESMEEQKLDILISPDIADPFVRLAKENGVLL